MLQENYIRITLCEWCDCQAKIVKIQGRSIKPPVEVVQHITEEDYRDRFKH